MVPMMKKIILALGIASLCIACTVNPKDATITEKFVISDPCVKLTDQLASIHAEDLQGANDAETAQNILNWQHEYMKYADPGTQEDASYAMRWNYFLPGIFPVSEMISERTMQEDGKTKIYGVCWDFAAMFISVAKSYQLTTRMTAWKEYMPGVTGGQNGMGPTEYNALKPKLLAHGVDFTQDQINAAAHETWKHYRAEVFIDGTWKAYDGTDPTGDYVNDANYTLVSWDEGAKAALTIKE